MSKIFLASEKIKIEKVKQSSDLFSQPAKDKGEYKSKKYDFCLPTEYAYENLFEEIRISALGLFLLNGIKWHDGHGGLPSTHLCDSQVSCVNFLLPFADKPDALKDLLEPIFPGIQEMLPVEHGLFVSFEWIGAKNYLNEKIRKGTKRTRGANFTSADAIVRFRREDGTVQVVLIEWKYTESYTSTFIKRSKSGTDRSSIYKLLFEASDCPVSKKLLPHYDDLFYEPFYQFTRQQLLAYEMEKGKELEADAVSVLHISPKHNTDFKFITSPKLQPMGNSATEVWKKLLITPDKFLSVNTEDLFGKYDVLKHPELVPWKKYIDTRYFWINENLSINNRKSTI